MVTPTFSDNCNVNASNFPNWGGNYNNTDNAGLFNWNFNNSATNTNGNIGSRTSPHIHAPTVQLYKRREKSM